MGGILPIDKVKFDNPDDVELEGNRAVGETAASLASGFASWIPAGLSMFAPSGTPETEVYQSTPELTMTERAARANKIQEALTYEPKSETGRALTETVMKPLTAVSNKFEEGALYSEKKYQEAIDRGDQDSADRWNAMIGIARTGKDAWMFALPVVFKGIKGLAKITKEATSLEGLKDVIPETKGVPPELGKVVKADTVKFDEPEIKVAEQPKNVAEPGATVKPQLSDVDILLKAYRETGNQKFLDRANKLQGKPIEERPAVQVANVPDSPEVQTLMKAYQDTGNKKFLQRASKLRGEPAAIKETKPGINIPVKEEVQAEAQVEGKQPFLANAEIPLSIEKAQYNGKTHLIARQGTEQYKRKNVGEIAFVNRADGNAEISNVSVSPDMQRSGYGTELYRKAFEEAQSQGKKLYISNDRTPDAIKLHEQFKKKGILKEDGEIIFDDNKPPAPSEIVQPVATSKAVGGESGIEQPALPKVNPQLEKDMNKLKITSPEGNEKVRGLAENTENEAIRAGLVDDRGDMGELPTYITRDPKAAQEIVTKLLNENYDSAIRIIEGKEKAPEGVFPEDVFTGVRVRAELKGDVDTLTKLLDSPLVAEATKLGQRIQALYTANADSPFAVLKGIIKERSEALKRQGKEPVSPAKVAELEKALADKQKAFDEYVAKAEEVKVNVAIDEIVKPKYKPVFKEKYGAKNKVVTQEEYLKTKAELRSQFSSQLSAGLDPTIAAKLGKIGAYHLEAGTRVFADWSKRVIEDVGEWAKPHLKDIYKQATSNERKVTAEAFSGKITQALNKGKDKPDIGIFIQKLAKQLVAEGITDRNILVKEVHNILKDIIPDITPRETADAISGYGKYKQLSKDEISVQLRDIKGQLQQISKLEDLQSKGTAEKTGVERRTPSDEERRLIKLVDEAKKKYGIEITDPETQLRTKQETLRKRLINEASDLKEKLKNMDFAKKENIKTVPDADMIKLKEARDIAKKNYRAAQGTELITKEEIGTLVDLSKTMTDAKTVMEQGGDRFKYGAAKVVYERYIKALKGEDAPLKTQIKNKLAETKINFAENKIKAITGLLKDAITNISDISISLVASIDNSFLGRQGLNTLMTHPTVWAKAATKSFSDIYRTLVSKHGGVAVRDALMADVYSRPNYLNGSYDLAKLIPKNEEQFPTSLPERIPIAGRVFKASENAFVNSAVRMRINTFDLLQDIAKKNGVNITDKVQIQEMGKLINSITARGDLGRLGEGGVIRLLLWAPKMLKGNWDVLTAHTGGAGLQTPFARQQARMNLIKIVGETAAVAAIINAISPGSVETNPLSSDFMKIKVGNTRYDITGGKGSIITLLARAITFSTKSTVTHKTTPLNSGKYGARTVFDVGMDFLANKTTPTARAATNIAKGRDFQGQKPTVGSVAYGLTTPISIQNFVGNFYGKDADGSVQAVIGSIVDIVGINANTYKPYKKSK